MKNKNIITTIFFVAILIFVYFVIQKNKNLEPSVSLEEEALTETESQKDDISVNILDGKNIMVFDEGGVSTLKSENLKNSITFKEVDVNRNMTYDLFIGDKKIGEISALEIYNTIFSPDQSLLLFQTNEVCGAECAVSTLYLVDFNNQNLKEISTPKSSDEYEGFDKYNLVYPFIDKYSWTSEDMFKINFYFLKSGVYRVSPIEVWEYNLNTEKYNFIETLPEGV